MSFVKKIAQYGGFGLAGMAGAGDFKSKSSKSTPQPSLITASPTPPPPSLVNKPTIY